MIPIIIGSVVAILLLLVGIVAMRSAEFRITRSLAIAAPAACVFANVNDFHNWKAWSPWAKLDPNAKNTFSGPSAGTGASFAWDGNSKVGAGEMTITECRPHKLILIRLAFLRPFRNTNQVEFTFQTEGRETLVTWNMSGQNNFIGKAFSLFCNVDKMVGGEFEKGLMQLKAISEATP